ncbi:MAG: ribonuclease HIII [Bacillales bacterium]|nr:ribonuclease HIII [Bacillales bacterium]
MHLKQIVNQETLKKMFDYYQENIIKINNPNLFFQARQDGIIINAYKTGTVTYDGEYLEDEALMWGEIIEDKYLYLDNQIGSDEVGTGDYFGPIVVVASYLKKEQVEELITLGIKDSKKLNDSKILELALLLIKKVKYSLLTCEPKKYNEMVSKGLNMNSIKAKLHYRALNNLYAKYPNVPIIIDEFVNEKAFYNYLDKSEITFQNINFHQKGESIAPSIAVSSIIARFHFLNKIKEMENKYKLPFPLGANMVVDVAAQLFAKQYSFNELNQVAKVSFANTKRLSILF